MSTPLNTPAISAISAAHAIFQSGTVKIDLGAGFKLKVHDQFPDAPSSPIYLNLRPLGQGDGQLLRRDFDHIGLSMADNVRDSGALKRNTWVAGIPSAGVPILNSLYKRLTTEEQLKIRTLELVKSTTPSERRISGIKSVFIPPLSDSESVMLIDDLVTQGETKREAIGVIEAAGGKVEDIFVFLNRSKSARATLAQRGATLHAVWEFDDLIMFASNYGYLTAEARDAILQYPNRLEEYLQAQK